MRSAQIAVLALAAAWTARADFSYIMTQKSAQGPAGDQVVKHSLKGQKMKQDRGNRVMILDFGAQTLTAIDNAAKSYTVTRFADLGAAAAGAGITIDVKSTGQKKTINGLNATQVLMTMDVDMPQARQAGMKPTMEVEMWISRDVPGGQELTAFYKKNAANFPAAAWGAGNTPGIQNAMAKLQRQLAELDGMPVMEVIRVKMGGPDEASQQLQQMAQARAQLEMMAKQGGPQAQAAQAALARMGGSAGALFEVTLTAADFSSAPLPDSAFAIPAGYTQAAK